jgi:hypothetical protein
MKRILAFILAVTAAQVFAQATEKGQYGTTIQTTGSAGQTAQDSTGWQDDGTTVRTVTRSDGVVKYDMLDIPANAWTSTATNGATDTTLFYMPSKSFSNTTAETIFVDISIPKYFVSFDSVQLDAYIGISSGDSTGWAMNHKDVADGETFASVAFSSTINFTSRDMGTTVNLRKVIKMTTAVSGIAANDVVRVKLWRDVGVANNAPARSKLRGIRFYGVGIK